MKHKPLRNAGKNIVRSQHNQRYKHGNSSRDWKQPKLLLLYSYPTCPCRISLKLYIKCYKMPPNVNILPQSSQNRHYPVHFRHSFSHPKSDNNFLEQLICFNFLFTIVKSKNVFDLHLIVLWILMNSIFLSSDPIFVDFGRISEWNCPVEGKLDGDKKRSSLNSPADLDSEPSINSRRKYKGKYQLSSSVSRWDPLNAIINLTAWLRYNEISLKMIHCWFSGKRRKVVRKKIPNDFQGNSELLNYTF